MEHLYKKITIFIIAGIATIGLYLSLFQPFVQIVKYKHRTVWDDDQRYLWMLSNEAKLDTTFGNNLNLAVVGNVRESDKYFTYNLVGSTTIHILEFTELKNTKISEVNFSSVSDFNSFVKKGVGIFNEDLEGWPVIAIKYKLPFDKTLNVNFDRFAQLNEIRNSNNCKAFFGSIANMSLGNSEGEELVLFDFTKSPKVLISFLNARSRFFIVIITSDSLEESYINLLNLN